MIRTIDADRRRLRADMLTRIEVEIRMRDHEVHHPDTAAGMVGMMMEDIRGDIGNYLHLPPRDWVAQIGGIRSGAPAHIISARMGPSSVRRSGQTCGADLRCGMQTWRDGCGGVLTCLGNKKHPCLCVGRLNLISNHGAQDDIMFCQIASCFIQPSK